jgi:hypothetical protein
LVRVQSSLPTNIESPVRWVFIEAKHAARSVNGEYGYDTANVDRNHFGATLVEDPFRPFDACGFKVNAAPRKRGRIFFARRVDLLIAINRLF